MRSLMSFFDSHFGVLVAFSSVVGLLGKFWYRPEMLPYLEGYMVLGLFIMLMIAVIKMGVSDLKKGLEDLLPLTYLTVAKLILLPLLVFGLALMLPAEYRVALLLLAVIPAATSTSALAVLFGGNIRLGLAVTVSTSLIAPFIIPFLLQLLLGETIDIDVWSMFRFLLFMIVGPFVLGFIIKRSMPKTSNALLEHSSGIISFIIFSFIVAAIGPYAVDILQNLELSLWAFLIVVGFTLLSHAVAWLMFARARRKNLIVSLLVMAYPNVGLAILIASQYFDAITVLTTVMSEFTWTIGLVLMKKIFNK